MDFGRKDTNTDETFDMSLAGEFTLDDGKVKIKGTNKSGDKYLWEPEGFFNNVLKRLNKLEKEGVYVHIHVHALDDGESCELGRIITGKKGKFVK